MRQIKFFLVKHYDYLLTLLLFITLLGIVVYTFLISDLIAERDRALTVTLSSIGILFAVFQFVFTQLNSRKKKYFDLRYAFYKETIRQLQTICEIVQEGPLRDVKPEDVIHKLMAAANEFRVATHAGEEFLFPGLLKLRATHKVNEHIQAMVRRTAVFHASVANDDSDHNVFIESMNWHNEVREPLSVLIEVKHHYFAAVRQYL
jgi:hypothetical protein